MADTPGARIEAAAVASGLVIDPATAPFVGSFARENDRLCLVPAAGGTTRIGVAIDYGKGQRCRGRGSARRSGERVAVDLGDCRFEARFDGERIVFPPTLPEACERLCTGRASLAAVIVDRLSVSVSEASTVRDAAGKPLCAG